MSQTTARKTAPARGTADKKTAAAAPRPRRVLSPEEAHLIAMMDETMTRLDAGIAKEHAALDALLSRMAQKAA